MFGDGCISISLCVYFIVGVLYMCMYVCMYMSVCVFVCIYV